MQQPHPSLLPYLRDKLHALMLADTDISGHLFGHLDDEHGANLEHLCHVIPRISRCLSAQHSNDCGLMLEVLMEDEDAHAA
jgi:hypothetical protein